MVKKKFEERKDGVHMKKDHKVKTIFKKEGKDPLLMAKHFLNSKLKPVNTRSASLDKVSSIDGLIIKKFGPTINPFHLSSSMA